MLKSINIQNFRRLENIKIKKTGRLNLIIGKNNTGKTSLLEALYIYANKGDLLSINQIVKQRGEHSQTNEIDETFKLLSQFTAIYSGRKYDFKNSKPITIGEIKGKNIYEFNPVFYKTEINENIAFNKFNGKETINLNEILEAFVNISKVKDIDKDVKIGFQIKYGNGEPEIKSVDAFGEIFNLFNPNTKITIPCVFIPSSSLTDEIAFDLWEKISLTDNEQGIIEIIKIIDENIERITFKSKQGKIPYIRIKNNNEPITAKSMGEGLSKLLNLSLAIYNCQNGILLIDEFENGFHYSIQPQIWEFLFKISEKLNIQIFATTHSKDCLYSFISTIEKNPEISANVIKLSEFKNNIEILEYENDELFLVKDQHSELR